MSNDVNSSAMHSLAEAAGSQSIMPKFSEASKAFEAALAGEQVVSPSVPTQKGRSTAPILQDALKVPPPDQKGPSSRPEKIMLESEDAPNPLATTVDSDFAPQVAKTADNSGDVIAKLAAGLDKTDAAAPVEEAKAAETAPVATSPGEAAGWAAIKRAEAKLVEERKRFRAEQEQIQAQTKQLQELQQKLQQAQESTLDEVRRDPFAVLAKAGWNQRTLLEYAEKVAAGEASPTPGAQAVPQAPVPPQQQPLTHEQVAHMVAAHTKDIEYRANLKSELHKDEFKLLRAHPDAERAMYNFAVSYAAEKQVILTPTEVARILQDEYRTSLRETLGHEVIRQELGYLTPSTPTQTPPAKQQTQSKQLPQTITNDAGTIPQAPPSWKDLPEHARIAALAKQLPKDLWNNT